MSKPNSTALQLTVKVVRECATKTLNHQRCLLDERLRDIARAHNAEVERHNTSWVTHLFVRKLRQPVDVELTIETWKKLWIAGKLYGEQDGAYYELCVSLRPWWQRLKQFEALPEADNDKLMMVSVEDLDLFDYNSWMKEQ